jgi:putative endonuclease
LCLSEEVIGNGTFYRVIARSVLCDEAIQFWNMSKQYAVYIMTNKYHRVLYTGVTNELKRRVYQHKAKIVEGFTKKYNVNKLVYYEVTSDIDSAILREKQIKGGSRKKKIDLINGMNPEWKDLYDEI